MSRSHGNEVEGREFGSTTILVCSTCLRLGLVLVPQFDVLVYPKWAGEAGDTCNYAASLYLITLPNELFSLNSFYREPL